MYWSDLLGSPAVKRFRAVWQSLWVDVDRRVRLGRVLGMVFVTAGFAIIGLAWNGAASKNLIQSQFPYLLSGGVMGLGLIVLGATLWMLSTIRGERQVLTEKVDEMIRLLSRNLVRTGVTPSAGSFSGSTDRVIATNDAYHLEGCRILEGKTDLVPLTVGQAVAEGLAACRVCDPPRPPAEEPVAVPVGGADGSVPDVVSDNGAKKEKETA
jgi:hypothetical protein